MCATPNIADAVEILASMKRTGVAVNAAAPQSPRP
jgi:hypothetical protein